jgi:hypothetical protein
MSCPAGHATFVQVFMDEEYNQRATAGSRSYGTKARRASIWQPEASQASSISRKLKATRSITEKLREIYLKRPKSHPFVLVLHCEQILCKSFYVKVNEMDGARRRHGRNHRCN